MNTVANALRRLNQAIAELDEFVRDEPNSDWDQRYLYERGVGNAERDFVAAIKESLASMETA